MRAVNLIYLLSVAPWSHLFFPRRDLEIQLKTAQVHIAPASGRLAANRNAGTYRNYGERLYVEGRLEAMKKEQLVGGRSKASG
jgi:hypothetical protein